MKRRTQTDRRRDIEANERDVLEYIIIIYNIIQSYTCKHCVQSIIIRAVPNSRFYYSAE